MEVTNERTTYGHLLYVGKCIHCSETTKRRIMDFKKHTSDKCRHYTKHGARVSSWKSNRLSHIFTGMQIRCYDEENKAYRFYGAKGIKVCEEWLQNPELFQEWAYKNGYAENLTIDRRESSKDYCPENCRWITALDNSRYKDTTKLTNVNGIVKIGREWADYLGIGTNRINIYLRKHGEEYTKQYIASKLDNLQLNNT